MNMQTTPFIDKQTLVTATTTSGSFVYNMLGVGRASLQLNGTLTTSDTAVITLTASNDNVNFAAFSTAKTVTLTGGGTVNALFELGSIDYAYLKVGWGAPSASTLSLVGVLYGVDGKSAL